MAPPKTRILLACVLLLSILGPRSVVAETKMLIPETNTTGYAPGDYECRSERAPDYYGIGVRLGVYFSWFTGWLANTYVSGDIAGALDTNAVFLFANIVAMVRCTITRVLTQLDALILMHMAGGTIFSVLSLWGYRTVYYQDEGFKAIRHFGGFGTHLRLLLSMAVSCYGLWFWMIGIRSSPAERAAVPGPCATVYTFMFAKVRATEGIRIFYIIVCISCILYFGVMLLASSLSAYARVEKMFNLAKLGKWRTTTRLRYATGLRQKQLKYMYHFLRVANFLWIVFSMVLVEMTLNYNHIKSVLGPGGRIYFPSQLIPMIIGAFSFCRLVYKMYEKRRDPDDEPSLGVDTPIDPNTQQQFPRGRKIVKVFAPPTNAVHPPPSPKDMPPEDDDVDELLKDERPWLRYVISWLPWISLLYHRRAEEIINNNNRKNVHDRTRDSYGRSYSPSSTLHGSMPNSPTGGWAGTNIQDTTRSSAGRRGQTV